MPQRQTQNADGRAAARLACLGSQGRRQRAAIVPGAPDKSLLLKALSYQDIRLKMPPTGKLADQQIADFRSWIQMGAFETNSDAAAETNKTGIDFERERNYWAFRPVRDPRRPLSRMRSGSHLQLTVLFLRGSRKRSEARAVRRQALAHRRVTFDLTGLPPTPREIADFLNDQSPHGFEKVVERLLTSRITESAGRVTGWIWCASPKQMATS